MMKCSDVRWRLTEFLKGETTPTQDDLIRDHLDGCADCALRLVANGRVDDLADLPAPEWTSDITMRVLSNYPVSAAGMMMVRHLSWVFVVSAGFAIAVFMFVRQMFEAAPVSSLNRLSGGGVERLDAVATQLTANPFLNYIALAVVATVLCVALIVLVDRPTKNENGAARQGH